MLSSQPNACINQIRIYKRRRTAIDAKVVNKRAKVRNVMPLSLLPPLGVGSDSFILLQKQSALWNNWPQDEWGKDNMVFFEKKTWSVLAYWAMCLAENVTPHCASNIQTCVSKISSIDPNYDLPWFDDSVGCFNVSWRKRHSNSSRHDQIPGGVVVFSKRKLRVRALRCIQCTIKAAMTPRCGLAVSYQRWFLVICRSNVNTCCYARVIKCCIRDLRHS